MLYHRANPDQAKGWYYGPWNSSLQVSVGYANTGVDEPHVHGQINEIYLVARGESTVRVEAQSLRLRPGDILVIEPGEAHTFLDSTPDYFHFVIHSPGLSGEAARAEKQPVPRARLGLEDQ